MDDYVDPMSYLFNLTDARQTLSNDLDSSNFNLTDDLLNLNLIAANDFLTNVTRYTTNTIAPYPSLADIVTSSSSFASSIAAASTITTATSSGGGSGLHDETDGNGEDDGETAWSRITVQTILISIILLAVILGTIIGNILVCIAVCLVRKLRRPCNYLLVSLAVSDLCVAVLVMPTALLYEILNEWSFGELFVIFGLVLMCYHVQHQFSIYVQYQSIDIGLLRSHLSTA